MQKSKLKAEIKNYKKGFTLIELLVVIVIIGILSSLLLANFIGVRQRSRDGVRKSDLRQIQAALELYRSDKGGYPLASAFPACTNQFTDGATPPVIYMQRVPCDPSGGTAVYTYNPLSCSTTTCTSYSLVACLENSNDSQKDSTTNAACTATTNISYTLQNP